MQMSNYVEAVQLSLSPLHEAGITYDLDKPIEGAMMDVFDRCKMAKQVPIRP